MLDSSLKDKNMMIIETFNEQAYAFDIIEKDGKVSLKFPDIPKRIERILVRPNFWVFLDDGSYLDFKDILRQIKQEATLVKDFYIDPVMFKKLVDSRVLTYTIGVAELYDFPREYARDFEHHKNDFKRTKNKEKVLNNLKQGKFN